MYSNDVGQVLAATTTSGSGIVLLPNTAGNTLGTILAYSAITIGILALTSQLAVRIARRVTR